MTFNIRGHGSSAENDRLGEIIDQGLVVDPQFPCEFYGLFDIWWSYD